jgi:replication factor A1
VQSLVSKKSGKEMQKADVLLMDASGMSIRLTLWGTPATTAQQDLPLHHVVGVRRARVSDYGGKSLSGSQSVTVEPPLPETQQLKQWWTVHGPSILAQGGNAVKSLSSSSGGGGAGGRMDPYENRLTVADIKGRNLGYSNDPSATGGGDYISFKGHFTFFKKDKEGGAWYTACPNKEDPCRNRCKVTQTTDGQWQCDRCHGVFNDCNRKWIFSATVADDTASTWVSLFDDQALTLFDGVTADQVYQDSTSDYYETHFAKALCSEWIFKCRVKQELHNEETKVKTTVLRMDPVDYAPETQQLLQDLAKWNVVPASLMA